MTWGIGIMVFVLVILITSTIMSAASQIASAMESLQPRGKSYEDKEREKELVDAIKALKNLKPYPSRLLYQGSFDPAKVIAIDWIKCEWDYKAKAYDFKERDELLSQGYKIVLMTDDLELVLTKESDS